MIGEQTIDMNDRQVPLTFEICYDPRAIEPNHTYAVQAGITVDGQLWFASTAVYPVITKGNPSKVEVRVNRVAGQQPPE